MIRAIHEAHLRIFDPRCTFSRRSVAFGNESEFAAVLLLIDRGTFFRCETAAALNLRSIGRGEELLKMIGKLDDMNRFYQFCSVPDRKPSSESIYRDRSDLCTFN